MMRRVLLAILILLPAVLNAQKPVEKTIASLVQRLERAKEDTNKVKLLNELAAAYAAVNTTEGIKYGEQGLILAEQAAWAKGKAMLYHTLGSNYLATASYPGATRYFDKALQAYEALGDAGGIAQCLVSIGIVNVSQGSYQSALDNYRKAQVLYEQVGDKRGIARVLGQTGNVYQNQSNDAVALEYLLKALKMNEELGDKSGIASNLNSIGIINIDQLAFPRALENFQKALKINRALNNKSEIARNLKNMGNVYISVRQYPEALEHYSSALKIHEELGDKSGIARNLGNMGNVYQELHDYPMALQYLLKASKMNEELGEKYPMANNLGSIGCVYLAMAKERPATLDVADRAAHQRSNLNAAITYLRKAVAVDKEIGNLHEFQNFAFFLSEALALTGNHKDALETYNQYSAAKDSIYSVSNNLKIAQLEQKREDELRQKQMEMQQLKISAAKHERRYYIMGLATLMVVSGGLFRRFRGARRNKRRLEDKNTLIAAEKENADQMRIRAERSERFQQQFLANMSHEIRTPMNAVNGMTDVLLNKEPRPDQLRYLQIIAKSSDVLLHIINDILDLSKIESGKLELETIDFSLADTIKQVKETLSFRAEEKGLQLVSRIGGDVPPVLCGDPFRLNQILINLGGNAIKFTEKGGVELDVKLVSAQEDKVSLHFSVTDTGIGIPADKMHLLFESFRQVHSSDSRIYGGNGLGLSISRQLIELQGGVITVDSTVGAGTTFSFELTYHTGSAERLLKKTQDEQKADGSMLNGLRILLVDDNEYNRMVASETLHLKADVVIDEATNGEEAILLLKRRDYDVVLMDIQMPVMNGLEATAYIRNRMPAPKKSVPIIALTASLLRGDTEMCMAAGMNACMTKPFKAWQLIAALAEATKGGPVISGAQRHEEMSQGDEETQDEDGKVTNLAYLRGFCDGDAARMKKFVAIYIAAVPQLQAGINTALAAGDLRTVAGQIHAFKPKWMMMGMKQSAKLGSGIEKLCTENAEVAEIRELVTQLFAYAELSLGELAGR
ncbi:MAG: tetratricopeptide repeat protein [Bacteroidota bacterium]